VERLKAYAPKLGPEFVLSPLLQRLAAEGKRLQDVK
jgi:3-hydroxyacyl-CoA dehydrogenase